VHVTDCHIPPSRGQASNRDAELPSLSRSIARLFISKQTHALPDEVPPAH
jgi:hypothetical protein